jgi:ribonuclease P protein component
VLAAAERIRRSDEFAATIKAGRRAARGALVVHVSLDPTENADNPVRDGDLPSRAGFVVSKAVGGAVVRNKVRRRLRHLVRVELAALPRGTHLVVRALPSAAERGYADLAADLSQAIAAARRPRRAAR